ncbi:hypothetical protein NQ317_013499 [Molorchus minor]|uniref:Pyruvate phosphate dikinase AMP/ATP-binding domain-containing protein n=1 Tax=Molorchus minor TaxID=1323400 RepID=A0ABQ9JWD8_9CUCU|nr:hypothetical protein NQ317_013499 [Molorchus minor]
MKSGEKNINSSYTENGCNLLFRVLCGIVFASFHCIFPVIQENAHSIYTGRDWFYLLKLHYTTNAIKRYKLKYREKNIKFQHTLDEELPTIRFHYIYGCDDKSNSIFKFTQQHNHIAEFNLCLHLLDGNQYVLPVKEYEKVEHIQFNLIFNASGAPTFFPNGMDTSLLAKSLAKDTWRDGSVDQFGYEQFGALQGVIKGDSYPDDYVVNFATVHSKYLGVDDRFLLTRALRIFVADDYGNLINVSIKSLRNGCSQFNFGSVLLSNNQIVPVTGLDILLQNVGQHKTFPDIVIIHIQVETKLFKCVVHLNKAKTTVSINNEENGYENYNIPAECDVNSNQARGIVEFWYDKKGTVKFIENELLCEKNVDVFPNILVSNIKNEDSKILGLTGGKGSSLALLSSLNSKDFTVPDGFIITINAYENQVNSSYVLAKTLSELKDACCGKSTRKLEYICKETVECFKKEKILPEIVEAIVNELNNVKINQDEYKFCGFAVRSSAIGEDSEELSAAGQNETFLGCLTTEQIIKSVAACWASQFTLQSVQYKRQHGLPVLSQMAVVVQKMVPADCAGVLFTCHPATSNPSQMTVVSGKTDPDTFILNRTVDCKISLSHCIAGVKNKVMVINGAGIQETDREPGEELSLTNEQALSLGKVGVVLEESFGGARDIEWAFCKDRLYLLQSRPVTTLNSWSEFELTHELDYPIVTNKVVLTIGNLGEVIPNSTTVPIKHVFRTTNRQGHADASSKHFDPYISKSICTCQHRPMMEVIGSIHMNVQKEIKIGTKILDLAIFGHSVYDTREDA